MQPIVTDRVEWSVGLSVCLSIGRSVTVVSPEKTAERDAVWVVDSDGPKEACLTWSAHWRHLANTIEPCACVGNAASLSNYFDHLLTFVCEFGAYIAK